MKFLSALGALVGFLVILLLADLAFAWLFTIALNYTFALHLHALHLWLLVIVSSAFISASTSVGKSGK